MLEFSSFFDAHLHFFYSNEREDVLSKLAAAPWAKGISCCHSVTEFEETEKLRDALMLCHRELFLSFGLHPQSPDMSLAPFLEQLLVQDRIQAVGEAGFDFFTPELKETQSLQEQALVLQVELAAKYNKPLVIHVRKALENLFRDIKLLQKVPAILFHSFPGTSTEAESLLKKLPDSYFSFGKQISNGNKKSISCLKDLPVDHLLLETDAPYQTLKGESFTSVLDIQTVYEKAFSLRPKLNPEILKSNFNKLLNLS